MEIICSSIYHIDFEDDEITKIDISGDDIKEYIENIIEEMMQNKNVKKFRVKRDTTEVISISNQLVSRMDNIYNDEETIALSVEFVEKSFEKIAEKLLESEKIAQQKIERMHTKVKKGSLIQLFIESNDMYSFVLIKIEHEGFLDTETLRKTEGLPLDKKVLKSCIIEYDEGKNIKDISLYDSASSISDYWWNSLLELEEVRNDSSNTRYCVDKLNYVIDTSLEKYPRERLIAKNKSNAYFQLNTDFYMEDYFQQVFDEVSSMNSSIDIQKIKNRSKKFIDKGSDTQFKIDKNQIDVKKSDKIVISEQICLILQGDKYSYSDKIVSEIENDKKVLKLIGISDEIYENFRREEEE